MKPVPSVAENAVERLRFSTRPGRISSYIDMQWENGVLTFDEALAQTGLKQATFYNGLRELRAERGDGEV